MMPPGTILQLLVGITALALLIVNYLLKNDERRIKERNDEDKIIDEINNATDAVRELDKLRDK